MGNSKRMGEAGHTIRLYSGQTDQVRRILEEEGVCYSRPEYVRKKYGESAGIFLTVYDWYVKAAGCLVPLPPGAAYPYWAFGDPDSVECPDGKLLTLEVPEEEVVLFDLYDWMRILKFQYMGETPEEEAVFKEDLKLRGLREYDIMMTTFYPEEKEKILKSWNRLFRHHESLKRSLPEPGIRVQAGLWRIKKEWLISPKP